jgi:hypothetical protein
MILSIDFSIASLTSLSGLTPPVAKFHQKPAEVIFSPPITDFSPPVTVAPVIPLDDLRIAGAHQTRVPTRAGGELMPERRLHHGKANLSPIGSQVRSASEALGLIGVGRRNSSPRIKVVFIGLHRLIEVLHCAVLDTLMPQRTIKLQHVRKPISYVTLARHANASSSYLSAINVGGGYAAQTVSYRQRQSVIQALKPPASAKKEAEDNLRLL